MQVSVGWATEYARFKHTVMVDEGDLRRVLDEAALSQVELSQLTPGEAFRIMDALAQRFSIFSQLEAEEDTPENARKRIEAWNATLGQQLAAVRKRLGVYTGQ